MLISLHRLQNIHHFQKYWNKNLFAGVHFTAMNRNRYNYNDGPPRKMNRTLNLKEWCNSFHLIRLICSSGGNNSWPNYGQSNFEDYPRGNDFMRGNFNPSNFDGNGFNRDCGSTSQAVGMLLNELQSLRSSIIDFDGKALHWPNDFR